MQNKSIILKDYTQIADIIKENNIKKPFVCCGKSFQKTKIIDYLKQFDIVVFDCIRPNPRFEDMIDGAKVFKEHNCDFMIGAGGGSPIDSANCGCILKLFQGREKESSRGTKRIYHLAAKATAAQAENPHDRQSELGGMFYVAQHFW